jgi:hypothetical protein
VKLLAGGARLFWLRASGFRSQFRQTGEDTEDNAIATGAHEGEGIFAAGANARKEAVAHHGASAMKSNLHILLGQVQGGGGFGGGQFLDIAQDNDGAVLLGKIENRFFEQLTEFGYGRSLLRIERRFCNSRFCIAHEVFLVTADVVELLAAFTQLKAP